jgi:hypothetical protein
MNKRKRAKQNDADRDLPYMLAMYRKGRLRFTSEFVGVSFYATKP